jgi:pyrroloquinoline-quinone synthase
MTTALRERLLSVMDRKNHWAWPHFTRAGLSRAQLLIHFRHELHTYVRDFPALLARVLGQFPPDDARRALAENIYEEQTGKLSFGTSHPDLFLEMMEGLGFSREVVLSDTPTLEPEAVAYHAFLVEKAAAAPWVVGAAVLTIFVEGSVHERAEMNGTRELKSADEMVRDHPLVKLHGCPPTKMRLVRAHRAVEGDHRNDAWSMVLNHASDQVTQDAVVDAVEEAHALWLSYRDGVARAMGLTKP